MKGKIKLGASISQDMGFGRWPACAPPARLDGKLNPDMIFDMAWKGHYWDCIADGFGRIGKNYGNGSIFVRCINGVLPASDADIEEFEAAKKSFINARQKIDHTPIQNWPAIEEICREYEQQKQDTAWLIEQTVNGYPEWLCGLDHRGMETAPVFVADPYAAIRFCRKSDAEALINKSGLTHPIFSTVSGITEHVWIYREHAGRPVWQGPQQ